VLLWLVYGLDIIVIVSILCVTLYVKPWRQPVDRGTVPLSINSRLSSDLGIFGLFYLTNACISVNLSVYPLRAEAGAAAASDTISPKNGRNLELCVHYTCGQEKAQPTTGHLAAETRDRTYPDKSIHGKRHV